MVNADIPRQYLHSWYLLIITFFTLFFLVFNSHLVLSILMFSIVLYFFLKSGLGFSTIGKISIYCLFFSLSLFSLKMLYPAKALQVGDVYSLYGFKCYKLVLILSLNNCLKLFLISSLSMSSGVVINYTDVILHLIVHKGLKLFWGYPLLLAINSIVLFKKEFERIKLNTKLRNLDFWDKIFIFFPLLVFAIRHSQRGALSLVTRGLNETKSFYFSYDLSSLDRLRLVIFFSLYFVMIGLSAFYVKLGL